MTDQDVIDELRREVTRLKAIVKELTEAIKVLSVKDARAAAFIERVETLLSDAEDARDEATEARDEAVDALKESNAKR